MGDSGPRRIQEERQRDANRAGRKYRKAQEDTGPVSWCRRLRPAARGPDKSPANMHIVETSSPYRIPVAFCHPEGRPRLTDARRTILCFVRHPAVEPLNSPGLCCSGLHGGHRACFSDLTCDGRSTRPSYVGGLSQCLSSCVCVAQGRGRLPRRDRLGCLALSVPSDRGVDVVRRSS